VSRRPCGCSRRWYEGTRPTSRVTDLVERDRYANVVCTHLRRPPDTASIGKLPWFIEGLRRGGVGPLLARDVALAGRIQAVRIQKYPKNIGKVDAAFGEAGVALGGVPFELPGSTVVQWPTPVERDA